MKYKKVFSILLFFLFFIGKAYALEMTDIFSMVDWSCVNFTVIGVCVKPPGIPALLIMFWDPTLLIETVKKPGDTIIEPLKTIISGATEEVTKNLASGLTGSSIPVSSGSGSSKISETNTQFNEVHIYEFPFRDQILEYIDMQCPDRLPSTSFVKYLSELDFLEWRVGMLEVLNPKSLISFESQYIGAGSGLCMGDLYMGFWGPTYPRRGFLTHQSEAVGSAAAVVRGVSIAALSGSPTHIVLEGIGFEPSFEADKLELIYPKQSGGIKIGQNPLTWESSTLSPTGKYLWVYWRMRICCVN